MAMSKQGTNTGSISYSPARKKRMQAARRAQERRWAARSGPVTVVRISATEDGSTDAGEARARQAAAQKPNEV